MLVTLIDYTGAGHPDPLYAARLLAYTKATRLEQGAATREKFRTMSETKLMEELQYIANTIRSSWEFVDFTFEIKDVTRAYTHQQVRTRVGVSFAQQAQRVADMGNFDVLKPETIEADESLSERFDDLIQDIATFYRMAQSKGVPNQDCRSVLPTNVLTNIIMKVNLRTLADLVGKRKNLRAQGEYADIIREAERIVLQMMPWTKPFLEPDRKATPALDSILKSILGNRSPVDDPMVNNALKELDKLKATWG